MNKFIITTISLAAAASLTACAADGSGRMDAGERLSARGDQIGQYGKSWSEGQSAVSKGQRMIDESGGDVADAEKRLAKARDDADKAERKIRAARVARGDGEQLVATGTAQMQQAEASYTAVRAGPPVVSNTND